MWWWEGSASAPGPRTRECVNNPGGMRVAGLELLSHKTSSCPLFKHSFGALYLASCLLLYSYPPQAKHVLYFRKPYSFTNICNNDCNTVIRVVQIEQTTLMSKYLHFYIRVSRVHANSVLSSLSVIQDTM